MRIEEVGIAGCYSLVAEVLVDERGIFVKTVSATILEERGLNRRFVEQYYSRSRRNVLRGMHFQLPPHAHDKLVYCMSGRAIDVILDLRFGSPTYGKTASIELDAAAGAGAYVCSGCAHGFLALEDDTVLVYNVTSEYSARHDAGILWSSFGYEWPVSDPILSSRDRSFPSFQTFKTPFCMGRRV